MNYLQVLRAELSDLQKHYAMRHQEKARSPEVGPDLHRAISRAEVAVSIAERTGKESAISGAQAAIIDAWRVTGTLA